MRGAVVGVGYLGTFHAQKYKALSLPMGFDFVGVSDVFASQAEKVAKDLSINWFSDPKELLGKVDFVTIATTTTSHFDLAKMFLESGVHVNVEKPMTVTAEEAQILVDTALEKNLVLSVGHSERFSAVFSELKARCANKAHFLELQRHAPFKVRGSDVSVIHDLMIHDLDLLFNLKSASAKLVAVSGGKTLTSQYDWVSAQFQFSDGAGATVFVSRIAKEMSRTIKVITNENTYLANFQNGDLEVGEMKDKEVVFQTLQLGKTDNLLKETEDFILSIKGHKKPLVSGHDGLSAMRWVEEIVSQLGNQK